MAVLDIRRLHVNYLVLRPLRLKISNKDGHSTTAIALRWVLRLGAEARWRRCRAGASAAHAQPAPLTEADEDLDALGMRIPAAG